MIKTNLTGTGVAIVTPFRRDGSVDFRSLAKLLQHIVNNGVDYIVAMGTTSEVATLTKDEKLAIISFVKETVNGKLPIVVGYGGYNTQNVINDIKNTDFEDVIAILSVSPYYNKPSQKGLYLHYKEIATASPVPVILYNVPGRTSVNINAETVIQLANDIENIVAVKEASGDLLQVMEIINNKPDDFSVISGDDALTLPLISLGGKGVISVTANALPKQFSTMVNYALEGNYEMARKQHYSLIDIINNLFVEGNPAGVKAALKILEISPSHLRLPLHRVSKSTYLKLSKLLDKYK